MGAEVPQSHGLCGEFDGLVFIIYFNPSFNVLSCIAEMEKLKQRDTKQTVFADSSAVIFGRCK